MRAAALRNELPAAPRAYTLGSQGDIAAIWPGRRAAFVAACRQGLIAAEAGRIVTFGVRPERPATEYGYISPGAPVSGAMRVPVTPSVSESVKYRSSRTEYQPE